MSSPQWRFASTALILLLLSTGLPLHAQVPSITLDIRVLGLPSSGLRDVGLFFPELEPGDEGSASGFAIVLPGEEAGVLAGNPHAILMHSLKEQTANPMRLRLDARSPSNPDDPAVQPYYEAGIRLEVTSRPVSSRGIALSTSSFVQIRRGPGPAGSLSPLLLETQPIKHEVQVQEGKTILLGGFFSDADRVRLPALPAHPESPLLSYVLSKTRRAEDIEVVVLLTPRRIGGQSEPEPAVKVSPAITAAPAMPASPVPETKTNTSGVASMASLLVPTPVFASMNSAPVISRADAPLYTVQAGAFRSRDKADALAATLEKSFEDVFVDNVAGGSTPYRVRVGRLPSLSLARQVRTKLASKGFESFIVEFER
jgi:cell division septation protein DedD